MSYLPLPNLGVLTNQNYLSNPDAESLTSGFNVGSVTLSSGVPSGAPTIGAVTAMSLSRDTTNKLVGGASFKISAGIASGTTPAGSAIISDVITISDADLAKVLSFGFSYKLVTDGAVLDFSGTSTQSMELWVYNVGLAAWSQPAGFRGINTKNATGQVTSTFQTDSSNASNKNQYRLAIIFKGAISSLTEFVFDQAFFSSKPALYGAPVTDWVAYTPTFTGFGTVATQTFWSRRVGDSVEIRGRFTSGTSTATEARITLPSGLTSDSSKVNGTLELAGKLDVNRAATTFFSSGTVLIEPSVSYMTFGLEASTVNGLSKQNGNTVLGTGEVASFYAKVPVLGWSSTVQMSNDTDTRVVAASYYQSGTATPGVNGQVNFDTRLYDTHAAVTTGAGAWKFTAPVSGFYDINSLINTAGTGYINLYKNGASFSTVAYVGVGAGQESVGTVSTSLQLNAGDYIDLRTASSISVVGSASTPYLVMINISRKSGPATIAASETVAFGTLSQTPTGTISGAAFNNVVFGTKSFDTHGAYSTSTGTYTVPIGGKYRVSAVVEVSRTGGSFIVLNPFLNGVGTVSAGIIGSGSGIATISTVLNCLAGQTINLKIEADGTGQAYGSGFTSSSMSIERIGN
jgi:hypothetical protein